MPGSLTHSPADILRRLLINLGLGTLPTTTVTSWPIRAHNESDTPDNQITIYDTVGKKNGRTMFDGEVQEHHGFQIRIRSSNSVDGYTKARAIAVTLDEVIYQNNVVIGGTTYCVHSVTRTTDVIAIGKEASTPTKRSIHTINGLISVRESCS